MYSNNLELHYLGSNWDWHAVCWDGHAVCWDWHAVCWEGHAVFSVAEWDWLAVYSTCSWLSEIGLQFAENDMQWAEIDICCFLRLICSFLRLTCSLLRVRLVKVRLVCSLLRLTVTCSLLSVAVCWDWHAICMQFAKTDFIYSICSWLILTYCLLYMQLADIDILFTCSWQILTYCLHAVGWYWHTVYSTSWFTLHIHMLFTPHDIGMQINVVMVWSGQRTGHRQRSQ